MMTGISSPSETGDALVAMGKNRALQDRMGAAGRRRVERFYDQGAILARYGGIYDQLITKGAAWRG
jgi:glycosyltransferase involved in cell wall biosynthesis